MTAYFRGLSDLLLKCTKPVASKGENSDLSIWREIFALYESRSIFCESRECTCLRADLDDIQHRYALFDSGIVDKNFVTSFKLSLLILLQAQSFQHPQSGGVFAAFKDLITFIMELIKVSSVHFAFRRNSDSVSLRSLSTYDDVSRCEPYLCMTSFLAHKTADWLSRWLCFEISKFAAIIPLLEDYVCPICTSIVWKPGTIQMTQK